MPINRADGITNAEKYLKYLCESTFLSLWSYSGVFVDQRSKGKSHGKELCDLLVVFENHIIIFSDKDCQFKSSENLDLDWQRWFRSAIFDSAKQAWGAERQIKKFPKSLFLDSACTQSFPIEIPDLMIARFHLVVVAHDNSMRCQQELGGSGSLMITSHVKGDTQHTIPFCVGDIDPNKTFVHVLDNTSLDIVLSTLDTISDFVDYLTKKEILFRSNVSTFATGEEDLLAYYLQHMNEDKSHDFVIPSNCEHLIIEEVWEDFEKSPLRQSQKSADKSSYLWDWLIEEFSKQTLKDKIYILNYPDMKSEEAFKFAEITLRFLAREPRLHRRVLANALCEWIEVLPRDKRATRYILLPEESCQKTGYVFLFLPHFEEFTVEDHQRMRCQFLKDCSIVFKINHPRIEHIVGISIQPNDDYKKLFPIILYFDAMQLTEEDINKTEKLIQPLKIMTDLTTTELYVAEYP
ncbi:MAG: hypothetical protein PT120_02035 [Aphanizomenon gracile PMC649.10]|nr:hypothetical protein [Aphanizomenon gracile PMC649.10]